MSGPTFTDIFCGAGGSSSGLRDAGLELKLAANHWARAIETHSANFPEAEHVTADVNNYDMRRLPRTDILWASPICTEVSPAGGRRKRAKTTVGQYAIEEFGHVPAAGFDRTRATFWDVIRATEVHRYPIVIIENVVEAAQWELFDVWLQGMQLLGYHSQIICVSSAHIGGEGNPHAPQWRDRMYVFFTRTDLTPPVIEPRPVAWCQDCGTDVAAVQWWKKPSARQVGKYGSQYLYRCPTPRCHAIVEPYVAPAATAIDWSDLGQRIGDRTKPLAPATIRRIKAGLEMFAQPVTVTKSGNTFERPGYHRAWPAMDSPVTARTTDGTDAVAVPPYMVSVNHDGDGRVYLAEDRPLPTRSTKIGDGLVQADPFLVYNLDHQGGDARRIKPVTEPMGAVVANARHHQLITPPGSFLLDRYDYAGPDAGRLHGTDEPMTTVTAAGRTVRTMVMPPFIDVARTHNQPTGIDEPVSPVTTGRNHGVVSPEPFVTMLRRNADAVSIGDPLDTMATARHHALTTPPGAFYVKHFTPRGNWAQMSKDAATEPLGAITGADHHSLVIPFRRGAKPHRADQPLSTMATKQTHGLLAPTIEVDDCWFRMLKPREHLRAQRFYDDYIVLGNLGEQTMQAGNSVSSNVAQWLGGIAIQVLEGIAA